MLHGMHWLDKHLYFFFLVV